jgi:hypothetical protein
MFFEVKLRFGGTLVFERYNPWRLSNECGGIYVFASNGLLRPYHPIYIGESNTFKTRLSSHEKWDPAVKLGASVVLVHFEADENIRLRLEKILIDEFKPVLNVQHKNEGLLGMFGSSFGSDVKHKNARLIGMFLDPILPKL